MVFAFDGTGAFPFVSIYDEIELDIFFISVSLFESTAEPRYPENETKATVASIAKTAIVTIVSTRVNHEAEPKDNRVGALNDVRIVTKIKDGRGISTSLSEF